MDKNIIEKYKQEMLDMWERAVLPTNTAQSNTGGLTVSVTTLRSLYPVPDALVTVFTGDIENQRVIDQKTTDQSGKTETFYLPTPDKSLSEDQSETALPYSLYNIFVKAKDLVGQIHLNIPVFAGVNSMQNVDLILPSALGENQTDPIVIDQSNKYFGGSANA
jgi:hypothetical protein